MKLPCESSANFPRPRLGEPAQRATVQRTKKWRSATIMGHCLCLKCLGRFWWGTKGFHTEIGFPHVGTPFRSLYIWLELANPATSHSLAFVVFIISYSTGMAAFTSTIAVPAAQLADAPQLEPAFEHLLRNSSVHESVIQTLRVNAITDRDTFVFSEENLQAYGWDMQVLACMRGLLRFQALQRLQVPHRKARMNLIFYSL